MPTAMHYPRTGVNVIATARQVDAVARSVAEYSEPRASHVARSLDEVRPVLEAVEQAAQCGYFVVGYVAYEAASAFDAAMQVHETGGEPFAQFVEFERCIKRPWSPDTSQEWSGEARRRGGSEWFVDAVEAVRDQIAAGQVYQVNLTDRCDLAGVTSIDGLFDQMVAAQRSPSNWLIDFGDLVIAAASPELFFRVNRGIATTRPMKGTARRGVRLSDDLARSAALLSSDKERAENVMIVDLLRNDLSRLAGPGGISVPRLFDLERYPTVWQMTSTVQAELLAGTSLSDLFSALFPCGSVTGAPKIAAMAEIRRLEPWARGVYCGAIGVVEPADGLRCSFDVAIRSAVADRRSGQVVYGSGCGITWDSRPLDEDAELIAKTRVLTSPSPEAGLIETLLVDVDGPRHLERHLARLAASAEYFGWVAPLDQIRQAVLDLMPVTLPTRARITADRSGRICVEAVALDPAPTLVRLAISSLPMSSSDPMRCHKVTERGFYAAALVSFPDADDVILVNERDEVVETCVASIMYRLDDQWWTPPLASGGLDGIGRGVLIDEGVLRERVLPLAELRKCDELAVVSSLRGRRPATLTTPERER
jgi:para-aminobenzoate synthetase / 4-amino-4-deoxychorismate lyase